MCWLLVDSEALPGDARRRLDAGLRYGDLGSGFALATADLDIRGAGELLGGKQTGHIAALGFETYARILEEAIGELRGEPVRRAIRDPRRPAATSPKHTSKTPAVIDSTSAWRSERRGRGETS